MMHELILATLADIETQKRRKNEPVAILKPQTFVFLTAVSTSILHKTNTTAGASRAVADPSPKLTLPRIFADLRKTFHPARAYTNLIGLSAAYEKKQ
ncbi:hypothetical protein ElyMa_001410200 [Elysia marginata]|uniref:Uncharacterized protein n=1 Tax=Elysia marginata TaxID=1093978 RepID=A0AAV4ITR7_9GAST|nr:hypothetical protein ElyMa_001410200 [Elysia marginata]